METAYWKLVMGWFIYLMLHSALASQWIKNITSPFVSASVYRIVYVVVASVGLMVLFLYAGAFEQTPLYHQHPAFRYMGLVLATYGVIVIRLTFKQYSLHEFLGLGNSDNRPLQTAGILSKVRHPLYSGTILLLIGYLLFSPTITSLTSAICILIYLPIGIWLEERKLTDQYGATYREYKKRVPMLFPRLKKK